MKKTFLGEYMKLMKVFATVILMSLTANTFATVEAKSVAEADYMLEEARTCLQTKVSNLNITDDTEGKIVAAIIDMVEFKIKNADKELSDITTLEELEESDLIKIKDELKDALKLIESI